MRCILAGLMCLGLAGCTMKPFGISPIVFCIGKPTIVLGTVDQRAMPAPVIVEEDYEPPELEPLPIPPKGMPAPKKWTPLAAR